MNPILLIAIIIVVILAIIAGIALYKASQFSIHIEEPEPIAMPQIDGEQVAKHIGLALQLKTISDADPSKTDPHSFVGFRQLLRTLYPAVFDYLKEELINEHALLLTWQGSDPSLDPIAFAAHQDVVPADDGPDSPWTYPPFSGTVAEGYVWGRGALDTKGSLIATLEAVNNLLREGFKPQRTIYLAFGHDEEVSGTYGAKAIAALLEERGIQLAFLLDEGGAISAGAIPGVEEPVGFIGVAEKGHVSLKLRAEVKGGHSAYPPADTAIGALSLAIATLESNPFPQSLEMLEFMMSFVGDALPFKEKLALANPWLFGKSVKRRCAANRQLNAITRTTLSPTIIHAGSAENVLPSVAEAIVNIRIIPGETLASTYEYVRDLVADDVVSVLPAHGDQLMGEHGWDPVDISDIDSPHFHMLYQMIRATFPGTMATPILMPGATDARHYHKVCKRVFRFSPMVISMEESNRMHGVDERLSIENAGRMVAFYQVLMKNMSALSAEADFAESFEPEELEEDMEQRAIRELNEVLPTKPLKTKVFDETEPEVRSLEVEEKPSVTEELVETPEMIENITEELDEKEIDTFLEEYFDEDFDDDAPLETKPLKKD